MTVYHEGCPDGLWRKFGLEFHRGANRMRTVQRIDDAVHMVQWQAVQNSVD